MSNDLKDGASFKKSCHLIYFFFPLIVPVVIYYVEFSLFPILYYYLYYGHPALDQVSSFRGWLLRSP